MAETKYRTLNRMAQVVFVAILATGLMIITTPSTDAEEGGFKLGTEFLGQFGIVTEPMETLILNVLEQFGMADAAIAAENALFDLAEGQVPVISKLEDPFQGNVEDSIAVALTDAKIALDIMNSVTGPAIEIGLDLLLESVLFSEADFGITLPTGRVKVYRKGFDVSICMTTVGPLGYRVTTGISNMEDLCGNPAPRMDNDTKALTLFTDMAVGYTHVQTRRVVIPSLTQPFAMMAPGLVAETYVKINGQWIQLRFAGADSESIELTAEFEVGLKAGVRAEVMAEIGGSVVLSIGVKPAHAGQIIQETVNVMTELAEAQLAKAVAEKLAGGDPTDHVLDNAGAVIKAGLDHLQTFSDDPEYDGELGEVSLSVGGSAALGVGIWDTGIAGVSGGISLKTSLPLEALVGATSSFYAQILKSGINLSKSSVGFFTELVKGTLAADDVENLMAGTKVAATDLVTTVFSNLLTLSTKLEMEIGFEVTALGETSDTQDNSVEILEASIKLPTGDLINTIATEPDALGRALEAAAFLMVSGIYPDEDINWSDLTFGIADGIEYSYMSMAYGPLLNIGFSEVKLIDLLEMMELRNEYIQPILVAIIQGGVGTILGQEGSFTPLRDAVQNAIDQLDDVVDETYLKLVKSPRLAFASGAGANGDLGAEGVLKLGLGAKLEGDIKASLLLLLTGREEYEEEDGTVLANLSLPVNFGAALGASIGEGVEFEVTGGGTVKQNLFSFTMTHWDGALPPPAGMTVNGFEVIEFYGEIRNDESFFGTGFLALPMGGIVEATFDVDANDVLQPGGRWWGGFDLGPLGKLTLAEGPFTNAGIEGIARLPFFNADFTLTSTGWLYGTFDGDITIGGLQLSGFHLTLGENGLFEGNGFIDLGGFTTRVNASLTENEFNGEGYMNLLGSSLKATNLTITSAGATGTFEGELVLFGHTLSLVSLELIDGGLGLSGTAMMDFFGTAGVKMTLLVSNGVLTATSDSRLSVFGTLAQASSSSLTFSEDGVRVYAVMDDDLLATINGQITEAINAAAMDAQFVLSTALTAVELAQAEVDKLNNDIAAMRLTVKAERQKAVDDAEAALVVADQALALAVAAFDSLHNELSKGIAKTVADLQYAQAVLTAAKKEVNGLNQDIANLDNWFNGLVWYKKAGAAGGYWATRATLVVLRDAANLALDIAKAFLATAERNLSNAWTIYNEGIKPVALAKKAKEDARAVALGTLNIARWALNNPDTDIRVIGLFLLRDGANVILSGAWNSLNALQVLVGGMAQVATYINNTGLDLLFRVDHASFEADYQGLGPGSFVNMTANLLYMGQEREVTFAFNLGVSPVRNFQKMADSLQPASGGGLPADTIAPIAEATAPLDWQKSAVTVTINATDNVGGSGIESITYSASGAQVISPVTVSGGTAQVPVTTDGVTTLTYFATDKSGNTGLVKTITVKVDQTAPTIELDVPANGKIIPRNVKITAADNEAGSGVSHMNVSVSGAETQAAKDFPGSTAYINLSVTGQTTLVVVVFDKAGNSRTVTSTLTIEDTEPPVVTAPADIVDFEATGVLTPVLIGVATATDNVGVVAISSDAPANFPVGTTKVVWTATDAAGNQGTAVQSVSVVDTTPPVVTAPADILDYEATGILSPVEIGTATATDLVGVFSLVNDAPDAFPLGTTIVTWTATDIAGNRTIAMQIVMVVDTTAPEIQMPLPNAIYPSVMPVELSAAATDIFPIAEVSISGVDCYKYTKKGKKVSKLGACVFTVKDSTLTIFEAGGVGTHIAWTVTATDSNTNVTVESFAMTVSNPGKPKRQK